MLLVFLVNDHFTIERIILIKPGNSWFHISGAQLRTGCRGLNNNPLHLAAIVGDPVITRTLISKDSDLIHMKNTTQQTPLHKAAQNDKSEVAGILINK